LDKQTINHRQLLQRQLILALLTALVFATGVVVFHDPLHALFKLAASQSEFIFEAGGAFLIVLCVFLVSGLLSKLIFKEAMPGTNELGHKVDLEVSEDEAIINSVASDLEHLPSLIKLLNDQLHAVTEETEISAYGMMEKLQAIDGVIVDLLSSVSANSRDDIDRTDSGEEMLANLAKTSQTLSSMLMEVLANIQFQDITRQQIEQVQKALNRLDMHIVEMVGMMRSKDLSRAPSLKNHIDHIYEGYVMDRQRDVHFSVLSGTDQAAETSNSPPKIELF
jgi:methyl-accepting chemotaxis protein